MKPAEIEIRSATPADMPAIRRLLTQSLGWANDEKHRLLFEWKHIHNPFGPSAAWLAVHREVVVAVRLLMRWRFRRGEEIVEAVRAVDTATHPEYRGMGLFRQTTLAALDQMRAEGVAFVFNTPNRASRPGYLRMGWREVGRPKVWFRPLRMTTAHRAFRASGVASLWSMDTAAGDDATQVLDDERGVRRLLDSQPSTMRYRTDHDPETLKWRYASEPVKYRAMLRSDDPQDGFAVFRLRKRGQAAEASLVYVLVPGGDPELRQAIIRTFIDRVEGDYALALSPAHRFVPVPRVGPVLTWRGVTQTEMPALREWNLDLGDIELF